MSAQGESEMDAPTGREDSTPGERVSPPDDATPRFGTLAWIRSNWDYDRETAPGNVLLVKFVREAPFMAVIPLLMAFPVAVTFSFVGATKIQVVQSWFTTFGAGFVLFWRRWWCLTIADPENGQSRTDVERSR